MALNTFLVEDEPQLLENLSTAMALIVKARIVGTAETERDAADWFSTHAKEWDLAVIDLFIKDGTGFGVLANMPCHGPRQRIVILTNSASSANRSRCLRLGADAVFDKTRELDAFFEYCLRIEKTHLH